MSTPINLNKHRKARAKAAKVRQADENAVRFGRSKAAKALDSAKEVQAIRQLDAHKREP